MHFFSQFLMEAHSGMLLKKVESANQVPFSYFFLQTTYHQVQLHLRDAEPEFSTMDSALLRSTALIFFVSQEPCNISTDYVLELNKFSLKTNTFLLADTCTPLAVFYANIWAV